MVKAGKQDDIPALGYRMPPPLDINNMVTEVVKALGDAGKMDDVLSVVAGVQGKQTALGATDMLAAAAQAFAKRGNTKMAGQLFDKAEATARAGLQMPPPSGPLGQFDPMQLRFVLISVRALRGDTAAVKTALQELPPRNDYIGQTGYQRVVVADASQTVSTCARGRQILPRRDRARGGPLLQRCH